MMNEHVIDQLDDSEDRTDNPQEVKGTCPKCKHKMHRDWCSHKKKHMTRTDKGFETVVERCACKQPSTLTITTNQTKLF